MNFEKEFCLTDDLNPILEISTGSHIQSRGSSKWLILNLIVEWFTKNEIKIKQFLSITNKRHNANTVAKFILRRHFDFVKFKHFKFH